MWRSRLCFRVPGGEEEENAPFDSIRERTAGQCGRSNCRGQRIVRGSGIFSCVSLVAVRWCARSRSKRRFCQQEVEGESCSFFLPSPLLTHPFKKEISQPFPTSASYTRARAHDDNPILRLSLFLAPPPEKLKPPFSVRYRRAPHPKAASSSESPSGSLPSPSAVGLRRARALCKGCSSSAPQPVAAAAVQRHRRRPAARRIADAKRSAPQSLSLSLSSARSEKKTALQKHRPQERK